MIMIKALQIVGTTSWLLSEIDLKSLVVSKTLISVKDINVT